MPDKNETYEWFTKGIGFAKMGKYTEAIECYDKSIKLNPDNFEVWLRKGSALQQLGKWQEAVDCFDAVLKLNSNHEEALGRKGVSSYIMGNFAEGDLCFDKLREINPNNDLANVDVTEGLIKLLMSFPDTKAPLIEALKNSKEALHPKEIAKRSKEKYEDVLVWLKRLDGMKFVVEEFREVEDGRMGRFYRLSEWFFEAEQKSEPFRRLAREQAN